MHNMVHENLEAFSFLSKEIKERYSLDTSMFLSFLSISLLLSPRINGHSDGVHGYTLRGLKEKLTIRLCGRGTTFKTPGIPHSLPSNAPVQHPMLYHIFYYNFDSFYIRSRTYCNEVVRVCRSIMQRGSK